MSLVEYMGKAPSMTLVNVITNAFIEAQFNPTEFEEQLGVNYARQTVPGLSHQVKQFINTEDVKYQFELFYQCADSGTFGLERMLTARKFLYAACHPWRADGINRGGAPRILFIWPKLISLTCVITSLKFKYTRFNIEGDPVAFTATVGLEEIRDVFVSMEDITDLGTQRSIRDLGSID